jgi:hypothetical protein
VQLPGSSVCSNCQLDLNHPDAHLLRQASLSAADALDARLELIGKIRFETTVERARTAAEQERAQQAPALEAPSQTTNASATNASATEARDAEAHAHAHARASTSSPVGGRGDDIRDSGQQVSDAPPARSHSGIQVLLLIVGVSLLSVGAIFFLIYAFLTFGLIWRSAIIASITIASIVGASTVKRRGLSATAEALSALAVVFVVLDIYALRANDLLVVGDAEGRMYWGAALAIASLGFMYWHRVSNLVLVNIVGFIVFPPAVALLAAGVIADQEITAATVATMAALAAASLIHVVAAHGTYRAIVERTATLAYAMLAFAVGLVGGAVESLFSIDGNFGAWMLALALIAAIHSAAAHRTRLPAAVRNAFATAGGVFLGTALWTLIVEGTRSSAGSTASPSIVVAIVASLTVAALFTEMSGRRLGHAARSATLWGSLGVWAVVAIATIVPLGQSAVVALQYAGLQELRRTTLGNATFDIIANGWPQFAILIVPIAMAVAWSATGQLRARIHLVLASAGLALSLSAPLTGTLLSAVLTWLALTTAALAIIAIDRKRRGPRRTHLTVAAGGLLPLILAYSSSWSSHETWAFTSVTTVGLLIAARYLVDVTAVRATLLGTAAVVFLVAAGGVGEQLQFALTNDRPNPLESWLAIVMAAVTLLTLSLWNRNPALQPAERLTLWWIGTSSTVLAGTILWDASANGAPVVTAPLTLNLHLISVIAAVLFVAMLVITMVSRGLQQYTAERFVAAALLAPATVWALDSASRATGLGDIAIQLAPATASVVVGALSMALRVRGEHTDVRRVSELSALAVAGLTATSIFFEPHEQHWLIALFVAITLLLASIARDGVFGSPSPRRHIVWAAVGFATWALWLRLDQYRVDALEAYVLPLAAIVLAISIFIARAELRESRVKSAPAIAFVGLLIAILPLSLNAASGSGLRTLVISGLCGALLLIASFVEPRARLGDFWGIAIVAFGIGLVVATASRTIVIVIENRSALAELDSWLLGAVAVMALASFGLASTGFSRDAAYARWAATSEVLLGKAIVLLYAIETFVLLDAGDRDRPLDNIRIVVLVALGGALLLLSTRTATRPLTARLGYLAFGLASVVGAIAYFGDLIRPLEWVTVILGIALLANGGLRMIRNSDARSLRSLSAGLIVTLVPSLIATFIDTESAETSWRIVALGIACVLAIVVGAWVKLQAPLLIGTIVVLIHAAHTFAPALVRFYQLTDWWVWAVVGGAIVLFLGITLERRIRDLKTLNARFSSLR